MTTFKINKNKNYTIMSNYHLRDKNLSLKSKGLLSFMLSLPENWDYSLKGLVSICKENKDAIRSALNELKYFNYLKIEPCRGENGQFEYDYIIYEEPFNTPEKTRNSPNTDFPYTVEPNMENPPQINTNKQIDKLDKTECDTNMKHNILTLELINLNFISEDDASSFYFDNLFQQYLKEGHDYRDLYSAIHYIVPKVIRRNFIDEEGNKIINKYGYFKNAIEANWEKLKSYSLELYSEKDILGDDYGGR